KAFKRCAVCAVFFSDDQRSTPHTVSGGIDAFWCKDQKGQGTVNLFLGIADTFRDTGLLIDKGVYHFCGIDASAAHLQKMCAAVFIGKIYQLVHVVDLSYRSNGKTA